MELSDEKEIIEFLKNNLSIRLETKSHETGYCRPDCHSVVASIYLGDEEISSSETDLYD